MALNLRNVNAPDREQDFAFRCVIAPSFGEIYNPYAVGSVVAALLLRPAEEDTP